MQKDITIYGIAEKLNLSATTVSRALHNNPVINQRTRDKVNQTAKELGYRRNTLASDLRKQESRTIGLLLHELNSNFVTSALAGIEKIATEEGYDMLIAHSGEDGLREIANARNILSKRVAGLIVSLALNTKDIEHFTPYFERKIPVVFFDRVPQHIDCVKVILDNFKGGYDATAHLIQNGYKRIAHITADLSRNVYYDRFLGYRQALEDNNIPFSEELVRYCNLDKDDSIDALNKLLQHKPDAFFITNDFAAAVCIEELRKNGLHVPDDIGVVGFNNDVLGDLISPKLTTINYPATEMGEFAAKELVQLIKSNPKKNTHEPVVISPSLVIRNSSQKTIENV